MKNIIEATDTLDKTRKYDQKHRQREKTRTRKTKQDARIVTKQNEERQTDD